MENLLLIIVKIGYVILGIVYLKSSMTKLKKPFMFYIALEEYNVIKNKKLLIVFTPFLIVCELVLSLLLVTTIFPKSMLILGVFIQFFYILIMLINMNKEFSMNCNCFALNVPKKLSTKKLLTNIYLLISIVLLYGLEIRA
ncbi:MauE/DoxX family redox-associated membrane protein [Paenibacillus sp. SC116]|uniref:MauE/DoxX family redox-associated membrane protein n=1 Tax=Paenibacillus sp. SC116 TaxID=2968986 RepID=UPI0035C74A43